MRKIFTIALLAAAVAFAGCESIGLSKLKMDSEKSVARVAETIEKHIKPAEYKPVSLYWYEREELSNSMEYLLVTMVGADNKLYTQTFKVGGDYQGPNEVQESRSSGTYDFAAMKYITPADLVPATVVGWIDQAKAALPEEYVYESLKGYTFRIDPVTGDKTSNFSARVTETGNKRSVQGKNIVTTYYEVEFDVLSDGSVVTEDLEE